MGALAPYIITTVFPTMQFMHEPATRCFSLRVLFDTSTYDTRHFASTHIQAHVTSQSSRIAPSIKSKWPIPSVCSSKTYHRLIRETWIIARSNGYSDVLLTARSLLLELSKQNSAYRSSRYIAVTVTSEATRVPLQFQIDCTREWHRRQVHSRGHVTSVPVNMVMV